MTVQHNSDEEEIYNYETFKIISGYLETLAERPQNITNLDRKLFENLDPDLASAFAEALDLFD